jgi:ADP-ribose pyrophosphatase YjhB (NUDIX family)
LPGGFVDWADDSWQHAAAREVQEEIGVEVAADSFRTFDVISAPGKRILIFGVCEPVSPDVVERFTPTPETSELVLIQQPVELAFPIHTDVVAHYFR